MNWIDIKTRAKKVSKEKLWDIWKPILLLSLISLGLTMFLEPILPSKPEELVGSIVTLIMCPMSVWFMSYMLKLVRNEEYGIGDITKYYNEFILIFGVTIATCVITGIGFMLLFIPGIILGLGFSLCFYFIAEEKKMTIQECLKTSWDKMNGHKMDYFLFSLSFIGWVLLCIFIIPIIFVVPYIVCANTMYINEILKEDTK